VIPENESLESQYDSKRQNQEYAKENMRESIRLSVCVDTGKALKGCNANFQQCYPTEGKNEKYSKGNIMVALKAISYHDCCDGLGHRFLCLRRPLINERVKLGVAHCCERLVDWQ